LANSRRVDKTRRSGSYHLKGEEVTKMIGGIKVERIQKTKFRKNSERQDEQFQQQKKKHHDKSYYRLAKEEGDYGDLQLYSKKNRRT